jgi:hypothetical protein
LPETPEDMFCKPQTGFHAQVQLDIGELSEIDGIPHNAIQGSYRQNMDQPLSIHEKSASLPDVSLEDFDDGWPRYEEPVN